MAPVLVTLNDLEGHSPVADLFKCNPSNICAEFYQIQLTACWRGPSATAGLLVKNSYRQPGIAQGSWLEPLILVIYIDDDVTLTEIIPNGSDLASDMIQYTEHLKYWSRSNSINVNFQTKTKEMIISNIRKNPPASLYVSGNTVSAVDCFKLLRIHIANDLFWDATRWCIMCKSCVAVICPKNSKTFWFVNERLALFL